MSSRNLVSSLTLGLNHLVSVVFLLGIIVKIQLLFSGFVSLMLLSACNSDSAPASDDELNALVEQTNRAIEGFPNLYRDERKDTYIEQYGTVRFDTRDKINLYYASSDGSAPSADITGAIDRIETRLGDIFTDVQILTEDLTAFRDDRFPEQNITNYTYDETTFKNHHQIIGGIVISTGAAYYDTDFSSDPDSMCANASSAPYSGSLSVVVDPTPHTYNDTTLLWVNMGNGQCEWGQDMVVHEIAHAMGMFHHLDDYFGLWSETAMRILSTLYGNPAGTPYDELQPISD